RHGVDDRRQDQDQGPHRHSRRLVPLGRGDHAGRQDRLRHQPSQRHGVDDRREDRDQRPHRHPCRPGSARGGDRTVSPVTGPDVAMRRFQFARVVVVFGLAGALVGVGPDGLWAVPARARCRPTAFVANGVSGTVSTIDVKTRRKDPNDITVGSQPVSVAVTPDVKTAFVANAGSGSVSTIDVKTRTKNPSDIAVGSDPFGVAVTPDGKTAWVTNRGSGTVSTIDVKTRTKNPSDIAVGPNPKGVAFTRDGKTAFVTKGGLPSGVVDPATGSLVSLIEVKTRTKDPNDITVGL